MATTVGGAPEAPYPLRFSVDYPEQGLSRLSSAFRLVWIIPIAVVIGAIPAGVIGFGTLFFGPLLMILFRRKYPRWWFDWNREYFRFSARVGAYMALLRDE